MRNQSITPAIIVGYQPNWEKSFQISIFDWQNVPDAAIFFLPILERPVVVAVLLLVLYDPPSVFEGDRLIIWIFWWRHSPVKRDRHRHSFIAVCILFSTTSWANHDKCATSYFYFLFIYYIFFNIWIVTKWKYKGLRYSNKCLHFENSIRIASISLLIITCPIWPRSPLAY